MSSRLTASSSSQSPHYLRSITVKVLGTIKAVLSVDDKANEDDFENDAEEEDIINDKDYKEKDEDDVDDDDKVVKLVKMKNILIKMMIPWC
ncbi:unnamed protein product [Sphagnum jensenii]|uniref:Uncharacterized protein n=1 Tax=Sphagnum jensenii TaxID=128206 RepID=A0ABP0XCX8_9BRYO